MTAPTDLDAYAVLVTRDPGGAWQAEALPGPVSADLDALVAAARRQPDARTAVVLVDVADEFFVAVRTRDGRPRVLLSDVTAALEWDLADQVLEHLDLDQPDDAQDVEPVGDLALFDDLGLDARELSAVLSDLDAYADEILSSLARRLGFAEPYERVVDALVQQRPAAAT